MSAFDAVGGDAPPFAEFPKIPRLFRPLVVTEKIDGTNAQVTVLEDGQVFAGSRSRWITPESDNHGFARWVKAHEEELRVGLGFGTHYGEWWGSGIQRGYGLKNGDKRFSLFNVTRWGDPAVRPACCDVVPVIWSTPKGELEGKDPLSDMGKAARAALDVLKTIGSYAVAGFMRPEGVVVFHAASGSLFKATIERDEEPKGNA